MMRLVGRFTAVTRVEEHRTIDLGQQLQLLDVFLPVEPSKEVYA
jgi:hypothetical protein